MAKYIDKSALVAEIKRLKSVFVNERDDFEKGYHHGLNLFVSFLDTLKVKELDLEDTKKEELAQTYVNYIFNRFDIDPESTEGELIYAAYIHGINECLTQLKAQK